MATPNKLDIQAVKNAMAQTPGMSYVDAARQVRGVQTAPVATTPAPVTPIATTPVAPTVNVQQEMAGKTVAERQAIRSGTPAPVPTPTPAPIVQAPVNATGLSTPLAPATQPTQPVETQKVDATPGITQDSFNQAKAESEKIKAQNEAVMAQNKQQAELKTQERQQIAQETAQASIPTDQKSIVNALVSGMSVAEQPTQAYRNAKVVADNFKRFNGMTDVQLLDNLKQGQIGTELDSLLSQNPNYAKAKAELAKAQKTASINRATQIASNVISGKETPVVDDLANTEAKYNPPLGVNAKAYQDYVVNNEDVKTAGSQVKQLSTQISDLSKTYNDALKSIKAQYPSMPASALLTLMGSRTNDTKELLDSYINAKELAKGDFDLAMKMAEGSYGAYSKDRAEQQQIASEQRQMQAQKDLVQYKSDFEKQQAEQALQDPATQIGQTIKEFADMGITAQGSLASKVAEANDFIAKGGTLGQYINKLRSDYMAKPEYQKALALKAGQMSDTQKMQAQQDFDIQKIKLQDSMKDKNIQNVGTSQNPIYGYMEGDKFVQVNAPTQSPAGTYNPKNDSLATITLENGKPIKMLSEPLTALATLINGNPDVKIDYNNLYREQADQFRLYGKGRSAEQLMKEGIPSLYADPTAKQVTWTTKSQHMTGSAVDLVNPTPETIAKMNSAGFFQPEATKKAGDTGHFEYNGVEVEKPLTDKQFTQYNQTKTGFKSEPIVKAFEEALIAGGDIIQSLGSANGPGDVGAVFNFMKSLDPTSTVREGEFALAAKSAGVWESFKNIPANKLEGTILTEKQRKDFGKLAMKYIESKGKLYDTKYNDMKKVLENQGIPQSYYPTRMTDYVNQYKGTQENNSQENNSQDAELEALYGSIPN